MNSSLASEAVDVGDVLRESIAASGGLDLLRKAGDDLAVREQAGSIFEAMGLWDVRPLADQLELEVAASASRSAGFFAVPYPVAERLAAPASGGATAIVGGSSPALVSHGDLPLAWTGVALDGRIRRLLPQRPQVLGTMLAPFAVRMSADSTEERSPATAALAVTLQAWWLLGLLEHAVEDTVRYTREREQFGRRLITFQGVGFQLADMAVALESLEELAKYTVWRLSVDRDEALVDALALRSAVQQSAGTILRGAHQLHGAMGFTDEVDVSWLSRAAQTALRLPEDRHALAGRLLAAIERDGWREFGHVGDTPTSPPSSPH
ncbi:acyl-CoA dehydrogenase family protein [Microbacterium immunditiarum]|uniref:Acyl-CoA dehydrogenase/oxidase C-terminal domain-containing protein n=1 Tax=Microbacterium immunditiarum TaxID=337480 RepID=A0A7Y9KGT3_9MICO|nr:acyl-CoA dehydrogenase family protein [Microbacterium immunditiarum]NYE18817.1 hypothetical protein [Microbacterium immunditiarum]